uniref:formin-like protein 13 n=1 Tax=Podarcis muralis TaxID=64176 RepID=UPI0010A01CC1|nr:formin-like protein 13 [Podarcis muralis]
MPPPLGSCLCWQAVSEVAIEEEEPQEVPESPPEEDGGDKEDKEALYSPCPPPGEHLEASIIEDCEEERPPKTPTCLGSIISRIRKIFRRALPPAPPVPPEQPSLNPCGPNWRGGIKDLSAEASGARNPTPCGPTLASHTASPSPKPDI